MLLISIAGGLLAATSASAASSDLLAQAASDSVAPPEIRPPTTFRQPSPPQPQTPPRPKTKSNRLHLHGGLFAPIRVNATSPTLGLRLGRRLGSHLQGGVLTGWTFQSKNVEEPVNGLPGLQPQLILARVTAQLVPAMLFLQVNFTETRSLAPYAGIAAGYEWYFLRGKDYLTLEVDTATYANYAWESWGGMGLRLDPGLRFDVELFYNGGSLEREVITPSGLTLSQAVHVNGVGARVGIDILF